MDECQTPEISVVTPTYNEVDNIHELVQRVRNTLESMKVEYEHIVIDNCSTDGTIAELRSLTAEDNRLRVIVNESNFGHVRSPFHGLLQARGRAVVVIASDLQDPPECIPELVLEWQKGYKVVFLVRRTSSEGRLMTRLRGLYYSALTALSTTPQVPHATGAGLYDREVVETLRRLNDPYPYVRGLVSELGYDVGRVGFDQPARSRGESKNGIGSLYDLAMLGLTTNSRAPLRAMSLVGFVLAALSFLVGVVYLVRKLIAWESFDLGLAPIAVGLFFLGATQLICLGILGEYVGNIFVQVRRHPLVIERERINFESQGTA